MQTRWFWFLLPFLLLIFQVPAIHGDEIESEETDQFGNVLSKSVLYKPVNAVYNLLMFVSSGNELYSQSQYILSKIQDLVRLGGGIMNPLNVLQILPYLMFALQQAKQSPQTLANMKKSWDNMGMNQYSMASLMKSPALVKKFVSDSSRVNVMENSLKLIAGKEAYDAVTAFTKEAQEKLSNKDGNASGISAQDIADLAMRSENFKKLFPTDEAVGYALNTVNVKMSEYLGVNKLNSMDSMKNNVVGYMQGEGDEALNTENIVKETLTASSEIFLEAAKQKIDQEVAKTKAEAQSTVNGWKTTDQSKPPQGWGGYLKRTVTNVATTRLPSKAINALTAGSAIANRFGFVPRLATYVLPTGVAFHAFRFFCLITYLSMVAHRESINIPKLPAAVKDKVETIPGLDTDRLINTMNNRSTMSSVFGENNDTTSAVVLKFVAGPEAALVDTMVTGIKDFTKSTGKKLGELEVKDLLGSVNFFQRVLSLTEYKKVMMRSVVNCSPYLQMTQNFIERNVDIGGFIERNSSNITSMKNTTLGGIQKVGGAVSRRIGIQDAIDDAEQYKRDRLAEGSLQGKLIGQVPTTALAAATSFNNGAKSVGGFLRSMTTKKGEEIE